MSTLFTTAALAAITLLAIWWHLRGVSARAGARIGPRSCPRCGAPAAAGDLSCRSCRVPLSAYEVVNAAIAPEAATADAVSPEKLHAVVRGDVCVGCGTCVAACPEPGAILLEGKRAIVNTALCAAHGRCVEACPLGAIFMSSGQAGQRIEVPLLDSSFQSSVAGLYVVGELGGRGLIKNAINEGRIAMERIAAQPRLGGPHEDGERDVLDVLIVGSGPAGISAGLEALKRGLRYAVLERGTLADTIRKYPRHKFLLAEPVKVPLYGDLWVADASKESLLKVWEAIIRETGLQVLTGHEVCRVERRGALFHVEASGREFVARHVVLAMGRRGIPRRLGVPGEDLAKVFYDIVEMETFEGRRVLVVGGGDSAVESAVGLSRHADVALSYRGREFARIKPRNQAKLDEAMASGRLRLILRSEVREVREKEVMLEVAGGPSSLPNDDVIVRIGGVPPFEFLKRAGVRMVRKDVPLGTESSGPGKGKEAHAVAS